MSAGAVEGNPGGRRGGVDAGGNVRVGRNIFQLNRLYAEEVAAVDNKAAVAEIVGVAAAIVAAAGEGGCDVAEESWSGADAEGAAGRFAPARRAWPC